MLQLSASAAAAIRQHAIERYPDEACGVLGGKRSNDDAAVTMVMITLNVSPAPRTSYRIDPAALDAAARSLTALGCDLIGIYHSHPDGSPAMTDGDLRNSHCHFRYLVLGVPDGQAGDMMCWRPHSSQGYANSEPILIDGLLSSYDPHTDTES